MTPGPDDYILPRCRDPFAEFIRTETLDSDPLPLTPEREAVGRLGNAKYQNLSATKAERLRIKVETGRHGNGRRGRQGWTDGCVTKQGTRVPELGPGYTPNDQLRFQDKGKS
jgi:hypothetical protein